MNDYAALRHIFNQSLFITDLGLEFKDPGMGWCETELLIHPKHLQQDGFVHAGVQATMADHSAGAAAGTLVAQGETVLTIEFKINLLPPAKGERLQCHAQVLKSGKKITVAESDVRAVSGVESALVAKATVTLAVVAKNMDLA